MREFADDSKRSQDSSLPEQYRYVPDTFIKECGSGSMSPKNKQPYARKFNY